MVNSWPKVPSYYPADTTYKSTDLYGSNMSSKRLTRSRTGVGGSSCQSWDGPGSNSVNATVYCNNVGITVPGGISDQKFSTASIGLLQSEKHCLIFKLAGYSGKLVEKAVTVNIKPRCISCNRMNKGNAKFCSGCGTGLEII